MVLYYFSILIKILLDILNTTGFLPYLLTHYYHFIRHCRKEQRAKLISYYKQKGNIKNSFLLLAILFSRYSKNK